MGAGESPAMSNGALDVACRRPQELRLFTPRVSITMPAPMRTAATTSIVIAGIRPCRSGARSSG